MNLDLIEELLNEDESTSLDFKREQYPFVGATEEQKSELLKDILAFANAWRRTEAYILVGVHEVKGARSRVVGITNHLPEASLQQFVNSKTNRPIDFSYHSLPFEGKQLGVIEIPLQERPFFLNKGYGKLTANVVYIRRGSSTGYADPDEIAKMGAGAVAKRQIPSIDLELAEVESRTRSGSSPVLESEILVLPDYTEIPTAQTSGLVTSLVDRLNPQYYRDFAEYLRFSRFFRAIGFVLENTSSTIALNARVEVVKPKQKGLRVLDLSDHPGQPHYRLMDGMTVDLKRDLGSEVVTTVTETGRGWEVSAKIGSIQPQAEAWSEEFYVGSMQPCSVEFEALIYADNLPKPLEVPLTLSFETHRRAMSVEEIISAADKDR